MAVRSRQVRNKEQYLNIVFIMLGCWRGSLSLELKFKVWKSICYSQLTICVFGLDGAAVDDGAGFQGDAEPIPVFGIGVSQRINVL